MPNNSASGGPLQPNNPPAPPLQSQALLVFLQKWFVQLSALDTSLVIAGFQPEPPIIPAAATAWMAFSILARPADTFPSVEHVGATVEPPVDGYDQLQRNEELQILCSFFDTGSTGIADQIGSLVRDNLAIPQNSEYLKSQGQQMVLGSVGELVSAPVLVKERWLYRVDLPVNVRRMVNRNYPVLDVSSAGGSIVSSSGLGTAFNVSQN
jgi:hypothetical protein